ncbi:hypothetical protein DFQ27_005819 [Actinomortierella ambigua]|uniref:FAD-binding domain-containing protein n=1 Tax=Actinomortierella ambigua TaxID=1343610 RepID=A0A9P6QH67_9FUNG|nr:hypothetical protein DFQ27_005819 [Actinomortierella ambigua]
MPREFKVLVVGAGMAGLMLGHLLERANIQFEIYERAEELRPLGSAMGFGANILALFEQIGIYEDFKKVSKEVFGTAFVDDNHRQTAEIGGRFLAEKFGYAYRIFSRPDLMKVLLSRVPAHKIHMGKKLVDLVQDDEKVTLTFADGTTATGDLVVGADGGYSTTREHLYKWLEEKGTLPAIDREPMTFGFYNLLGTTNPMDPAKYPVLAEEEGKIIILHRSNSRHAIQTFAVPGNRFAWNVTCHIASNFGYDSKVSSTTDWGTEATDAMIEEVREFNAPFGGKMKDFIDATPRESISRVKLEEKMFRSWYGGRVILVGDACHKMVPSAGQGAVNAFQDAAVLVNNLYDIPDRPTGADLEAAFASHYEERYPNAVIAFEISQQQSVLIQGQTLFHRIMRWIVSHTIPQYLQERTIDRVNSYRPQVSFLPMVPDKGVFGVQPRKVSKRYQEELSAGAQAL